MKKYIKIHSNLLTEFRNLTYKQIILLLILCKNDENEADIIKTLYPNSYCRLKKDSIKINSYLKYIKELRDIERHIDIKQLKKNKDLIPRYIKMKYSTFDHIINDKRITKTNVLIIINLLELYQITYIRKHHININTFLNKTFNKSFSFRYKEFFIETLEILKSWKYEDGSVFIKDYIIDGKNIDILFDEKG